MVMSLLIRYAHIPFYFCFSFAFSTSLIHHYTRPLQHDHARTCTTIALASSDRSRLFDGHMIYNSHVFTSILCISDMPPPAVQPIMSSHTMQSGTFYDFALCSLSCLPFIFNLFVFYLSPRRSSSEKSHTCLYQFPSELRFSTYASHCLGLILHYFTSHRTAMIPPSLLATLHLETIPYPQIAPPQSPIGFILRSPAL